jgi:hypothetical protein
MVLETVVDTGVVTGWIVAAGMDDGSMAVCVEVALRPQPAATNTRELSITRRIFII